MFHSKGPNDDPWGHPLTASFQLLVTPFSLTLFCRLVKYDLIMIKLSDSSEKPYALSLFITSDGCRESNGLLMSVESIPIDCLESTASFQSSVSLSKVVSQLCFFLYADMQGSSLESKWLFTCMLIIDSKTLSTVLSNISNVSNVIGR